PPKNRAPQRRQEDALLRFGPPKQPVLKVRESQPVGGLIAVVEGAVKVIEAAAQGGLSRVEKHERFFHFRGPRFPARSGRSPVRGPRDPSKGRRDHPLP